VSRLRLLTGLDQAGHAFAHPLNFPLQFEPRLFLHPAPHFSPSASMSALVAVPVLDEEVGVLFADLRPAYGETRQPARSTSSHAFAHRGFWSLPPVLLRSGWLASRARRKCGPSRPGSRLDRPATNRAPITIAPSGSSEWR
jgi:hypothetical protein